MCLRVNPNIHLNFVAPEQHIRTHAYHLWEKAGKPNECCFWDRAEKECDYVLGYKVVVRLKWKPDYEPIIKNNKEKWKDLDGLWDTKEDKFSSPMVAYIWKEGWNVSDRQGTQLNSDEINENMVYHGFHVYLDPFEAKQESIFHENSMVIAVHCHKNDFVAAGDYHTFSNSTPRRCAVFTKVFLRFPKAKEFFNDTCTNSSES